ncbi:hypothetical protein F9K50_08730 [bacterium]|nr:MAG: hypothetical protein F9K50_08730 [bacterium]
MILFQSKGEEFPHRALPQRSIQTIALAGRKAIGGRGERIDLTPLQLLLQAKSGDLGIEPGCEQPAGLKVGIRRKWQG